MVEIWKRQYCEPPGIMLFPSMISNGNVIFPTVISIAKKLLFNLMSNPPPPDPPLSGTPILDMLKETDPASSVDVDRIRFLTSRSLDSFSPKDRAYSWLLLLEILPPEQEKWEKEMTQMQATYKDFSSFQKIEDWETRVFPTHFPAEAFGLEENSLMSIIHGDLVRTGRILFFFPPCPVENSQPESDEDCLFDYAGHIRRLERVLYVFARMNVGLGYMQGFNELVAPFYYVLIKAGFELPQVEYLTFFLFQKLMTHTRINEFYTTQDKSSIILHKLDEFVDIMKKHCPKANQIITQLNIHPLFYCLRWFTLLFAQEHELPNVLVIWDGLFSHFRDFNEFMEYTCYVAMGHIMVIEPRLAAGNYAQTISSLQDMQIGNQVFRVLKYANQFWDEDHSPPSLLGKLSKFFSK